MVKQGSKYFIGHIKKCQICEGGDLKLFLDLGNHAVPQEYLTKEDLYEKEATYPLGLVFCKRCTLVQLTYIVPPEIVFPIHYPYRTGLTNMLVRNFNHLAKTLDVNGYIKKDNLVVDIGSNDGTLLKPFFKKGMRVVGIEPTEAADVANKNSIPTFKSFFNKESVRKVIKKYGKANIVTATNVFAHINDVGSLVKNVKQLLAKDGLFVSESQYLMDILEKLEFDTVYHEHLRFYSLTSLKYLLEMHGMSIIDAERINAAGGSIRIYAKKGKFPMSQQAQKLMKSEVNAGLYNIATYTEFADKVIKAKEELMHLLFTLRKNRTTIVGLTSSCRSNTLLRFMGITPEVLEYTGEKKGSLKIGMFTPGTHIPVVDENRIIKDKPDYLLILSWHIAKELADIMIKRGYKGKFIIPLPEPKIL